MERLLVAFEAPDDMGTEAYEAKWDRWVTDLHRRGLQLVNDLDPVLCTESLEVYEVTAL
jgi:hypothetical protein